MAHLAHLHPTDKVKEALLDYFSSQHEHVANSRKAVKNNPFELQPDTLKRITTEVGNTSFSWVLIQEGCKRNAMKHAIAGLTGHFQFIDYDFPNEHAAVSNNTVLSFGHGNPDTILIGKMGTALREIEETKDSIRAFMTLNEDSDYYLWSVWDMEMHKLQNAYTTLKKKVFSNE